MNIPCLAANDSTLTMPYAARPTDDTFMSAGKSNKMIARTAGIGVDTVKYHVNNILSKLNAPCKTEAACVAMQRGLIQPY